MSPVAYTWGPFSAKIFLKIWFCKIDPLLPPHIDFNTIPYFTTVALTGGVKEGKLKKKTAMPFLKEQPYRNYFSFSVYACRYKSVTFLVPSPPSCCVDVVLRSTVGVSERRDTFRSQSRVR